MIFQDLTLLFQTDFKPRGHVVNGFQQGYNFFIALYATMSLFSLAVR
jgi:hypothetical protein